MKMFPVLLELKPEGDHWLARCKALDVMTQGKTVDEATRNLDEALLLFMESCIRRGVIDQVLEEAGLTPQEISAIDSYTRSSMPHLAQERSCRA